MTISLMAFMMSAKRKAFLRVSQHFPFLTSFRTNPQHKSRRRNPLTSNPSSNLPPLVALPPPPRNLRIQLRLLGHFMETRRQRILHLSPDFSFARTNIVLFPVEEVVEGCGGGEDDAEEEEGGRGALWGAWWARCGVDWWGGHVGRARRWLSGNESMWISMMEEQTSS